MTYAIVLGREPLLSFSELSSVFPQTNFNLIHDTIALFELTERVEPLFGRLGGSIKLGRVLAVIPAKDFTAQPLTFLVKKDFVLQAFGDERSIAFSMSVFGPAPIGFSQSLKKLGIEWKKELRKSFDHVRYVESKSSTISSVTVTRNRLLKGCDAWFVFRGSDVYIIKTIAVQDYQDFSERDFGRPRRNAKGGMLPPKLARMMCNLAGVNEASVVFDPFVGSGTVLQEAVLLRVPKVIGQDISSHAVADTNANLRWIKESKHLTFNETVSLHDITKALPSEYQDVTHIVTEIDLGEPALKRITEEDATKRAHEAAKLASALIRLLEKLSRIQRVVIALPFWPKKNGVIQTPCDFPHGFAVQQLPQTSLAQFPEHEYSSRGGLFYIRSDQFVGREIIVLTKHE